MTPTLAYGILQALELRWSNELYAKRQPESKYHNDILLAHMVTNILTSLLSEEARTNFVVTFNKLVEENHENLL